MEEVATSAMLSGQHVLRDSRKAGKAPAYLVQSQQLDYNIEVNKTLHYFFNTTS